MYLDARVTYRKGQNVGAMGVGRLSGHTKSTEHPSSRQFGQEAG